MGGRMPRRGIMVLVFLLFSLLQCQTAICNNVSECDDGDESCDESVAASPVNPPDYDENENSDTRGLRPIMNPLLWDAINFEQARQHPYSSTVRIRAYNETRLLPSADGTYISSACTGTVIAWNMVLTAAHCFFDPDTQYAFELVDVIPGGPVTDIELYSDGVATTSPTAFGHYRVAADIFHLFLHPEFDLGRSAVLGDPDDLALVGIDGAFERSPEHLDATMKLNMIESWVPNPDNDVRPTAATLPWSDFRFYHFPTKYPMWVPAWGRMHWSHGRDVQILANGWSESLLNTVAGSSGSSVQVLDITEESAGGPAGGGKIRVVFTNTEYRQFADYELIYAMGTPLSPAQVTWIAGQISYYPAIQADMDDGLAPGLEVDPCLCTFPDGHVTLKVVKAPYATNCICMTGGEVTEPPE